VRVTLSNTCRRLRLVVTLDPNWRLMMDDGDALLKAILNNPAEDTPRLMYADWLEESGQPERAEFIKLQIELDRSKKPPKSKTNREAELLRKGQRKWAGFQVSGSTNVKWSRGFIQQVTWDCNYLWNRKRMKRLFSKQPIEQLHLLRLWPGQWGDEDLLHLSDGYTQTDDWDDGWDGGDRTYQWFFALGPCSFETFSDLPIDMGELLPNGDVEDNPDPNPIEVTKAVFFDTRQAALESVSVGAVRYGRQLAGLMQPQVLVEGT
jgi:uncharacterized protein (TIGR02996 family)